MYKLLRPDAELLLGCEDVQSLTTRADELCKILAAYNELDRARLTLFAEQAARPSFTTARTLRATVVFNYDLKSSHTSAPYIRISAHFMSFDGMQESQIGADELSRVWRFISKQRRRT